MGVDGGGGGSARTRTCTGMGLELGSGQLTPLWITVPLGGANGHGCLHEAHPWFWATTRLGGGGGVSPLNVHALDVLAPFAVAFLERTSLLNQCPVPLCVSCVRSFS